MRIAPAKTIQILRAPPIVSIQPKYYTISTPSLEFARIMVTYKNTCEIDEQEGERREHIKGDCSIDLCRVPVLAEAFRSDEQSGEN